VSGLYEKYTDIQEKILIKLCLWYKEQAPETFSFDNVLGHDECTQLAGQGARKNDPSGSLSMTMPKFRDTLKALWEAGKRSKDY
jgi:N-acetyl-anhydromuramyl-L-alanine amidase AmpD